MLALPKSFPSLQRITITGFSAGGQLVQRYAAGSAAAAQAGVPVHFVVGDPGSWMYLDEARLVQGTPCSDPDHCRLGATSFRKPDAASACPCQDTYKYGLTGISGYMAHPDKIRDRYRKVDMTYLAAEHDDGPQAGAAYRPLDKGCEADAQGPIISVDHEGKKVSHSFRAQRALTFWHYATDVLGAAHRLKWVKGCGHDPRCVYGDSDVKAVLFAR